MLGKSRPQNENNVAALPATEKESVRQGRNSGLLSGRLRMMSLGTYVCNSEWSRILHGRARVFGGLDIRRHLPMHTHRDVAKTYGHCNFDSALAPKNGREPNSGGREPSSKSSSRMTFVLGWGLAKKPVGMTIVLRIR